MLSAFFVNACYVGRRFSPKLRRCEFRSLAGFGLCGRRLGAKHAASAVGMRHRKLLRSEEGEGGPLHMPFQLASLRVEALEGCEFFLRSQLRFLDGRFQNTEGVIVDFQRYREGVPVLAAMRIGKPRRITEAAGRA